MVKKIRRPGPEPLTECFRTILPQPAPREYFVVTFLIERILFGKYVAYFLTNIWEKYLILLVRTQTTWHCKDDSVITLYSPLRVHNNSLILCVRCLFICWYFVWRYSIWSLGTMKCLHLVCVLLVIMIFRFHCIYHCHWFPGKSANAIQSKTIPTKTYFSTVVHCASINLISMFYCLVLGHAGLLFFSFRLRKNNEYARNEQGLQTPYKVFNLQWICCGAVRDMNQT